MSKDKTNQDSPAAPKQSLGQTLLIIALVILVGIIFGIGQSSLSMAFDSKSVVEIESGLTNVDFQDFNRIQTIVNLINRGRKPQDLKPEEWEQARSSTSQNIQMMMYFRTGGIHPLVLAKLGERDGLRPVGEKLDGLVNEFLNRPVAGNYKNLGSALKDVMEADVNGRTITKVEIDNFVANSVAIDNITRRYVPSLSVDREASLVLREMDAEKIKTEEATISTAALIDEFKEEAAKDETELQARYEDLKDERFVIPRRCHLSVIGIDANSLRNAVIVSDEEIVAYYNEHKEKDPMLKKVKPPKEPKEGEAPPMPEMVLKSLDESRAYIRGKIEGEKADALALDLMAKFEEELQNESLLEGEGGASIAEGKREDVLSLVDSIKIEAANDENLKKDVSLVLWKGIYADEPTDGQSYQLKTSDDKLFASMRLENSGIFSSGKKADDVFRRAPAVDNPQLHLVQIIDSFTEQSYKPFEQVKNEVVLHLAAERAYPELLKQAEALKQAASAAKKPGLSAFFEAKPQQKWAAQIDQQTYAPLDQVTGPEDADGITGETQPAIALTLNDGSWYLKSATNDGDMKRVTIGRVIEFEKDYGESKEIDYAQYTDQLERAVVNLNMKEFTTGLKKKLEE